MERQRSELERQERRAAAERVRQQEQTRRQLALEAEQHEAAEQEARRVEAEGQRAWEAAEDRRRIEAIEAGVRAEQQARLADVQHQLSAAIDRHKVRRTGWLAATAMGTALLASIAALAVGLESSRPESPPQLAVQLPAADVDDLSRRVAQLRNDNASLRDHLLELRAEAEAVVATPDEGETTVAPAPPEEPKARPHRPRPRPRPKATPTNTKTPPSGKAESPSGRQTGRLELGDGDNDPLAGIQKKKSK